MRASPCAPLPSHAAPARRCRELADLCRFLEDVRIEDKAGGSQRFKLVRRLRLSNSRHLRRVMDALIILAVLVGQWVMLNAFLHLLVLGSVLPERLIGVIVAIVAAALVARTLYVRSEALYKQISQQLEKANEKLAQADELHEAAAGVLLQNGLDRLQVATVIGLYTLAFCACVAYLFLGVAQFVGQAELVSTLMLAAIAIAGALFAMGSALSSPAAGGMVDTGMLKQGLRMEAEVKQNIEVRRSTREVVSVLDAVATGAPDGRQATILTLAERRESAAQ
jgi:hypothetical protein